MDTHFTHSNEHCARVISGLAADVATGWSRRDYAPRAFCELARQSLDAAQRDLSGRGGEFTRWIVSSALPPQTSASGYGEPAVTVHWDHRFRIDLSFWSSGVVAVQSCPFDAALLVVEGTSLFKRFAFVPEADIGDALRLGSLAAGDPEILTAGQTVVISADPHQPFVLYHLELPTILIMIRTHAQPGGRRLTFLPPGIAHALDVEDHQTSRRAECLAFLDRANSPQYEDVARHLVATSDLATVFFVLRHAYTARLRHAGLFEALSEQARARWEDPVRTFERVCHEGARQSIGISLKASLTDRVARLVVGLLLTQTAWRDVLRLVSEYAPTNIPTDVTIRALQRVRSALAYPRWDEHDVALLAALSAAHAEGGRSSATDTDGGGVDDRASEPRMRQLRAFSLIAPLFEG